jgi:hypothetical protein
MRYSIYILLAFIYVLGSVIVFNVVRMMRREARLEAERRVAAVAPGTPPAEPAP